MKVQVEVVSIRAMKTDGGVNVGKTSFILKFATWKGGGLSDQFHGQAALPRRKLRRKSTIAACVVLRSVLDAVEKIQISPGKTATRFLSSPPSLSLNRYQVSYPRS